MAAMYRAGLALKAFSLRWDTQQWHLGAASTLGQEPHAGRLMVALDLGAWMLLRLIPSAVSASSVRLPAGGWLPVQKRGHETHWHALRCTVYSARPVLAVPPAVLP